MHTRFGLLSANRYRLRRAVTEIGKKSVRLVARVIRIVVIDEVAPDIATQPFWQGAVIGVVFGVEMRNTNFRGDQRSADRCDCAVELRVGGGSEPVIVISCISRNSI